MATLDLKCRDCGRSERVIVTEATRSEFLGCTTDPADPYTEQEWESITHYLSSYEIAALRERLCAACQGDEVDWYSLPTWVKQGAVSLWDPEDAKELRWTADTDHEVFKAFSPTGQQVGTFNRE